MRDDYTFLIPRIESLIEELSRASPQKYITRDDIVAACLSDTSITEHIQRFCALNPGRGFTERGEIENALNFLNKDITERTGRYLEYMKMIVGLPDKYEMTMIKGKRAFRLRSINGSTRPTV